MVLDQETGQVEVHDGDDFVCPNCACEIHVRHQSGDGRVQRPRPFTCYCGTEMRKEPPAMTLGESARPRQLLD